MSDKDTSFRVACKHPDAPHTVWYWLREQPAPMAPYSRTFDNLADALKEARRLTINAPPALRWVKVFRADNEAYTCWVWGAPAPFEDPITVRVPEPDTHIDRVERGRLPRHAKRQSWWQRVLHKSRP